MDNLVLLIKESCRMEQFGGRVDVLDDMRTCLVYDVAYFPDDLVDKLKNTHHAWIEIMSDTTSLSGFVVRVTIRPNKMARVVVTGTALACMCAIVAQCLNRDI